MRSIDVVPADGWVGDDGGRQARQPRGRNCDLPTYLRCHAPGRHTATDEPVARSGSLLGGGWVCTAYAVGAAAARRKEKGLESPNIAISQYHSAALLPDELLSPRSLTDRRYDASHSPTKASSLDPARFVVPFCISPETRIFGGSHRGRCCLQENSISILGNAALVPSSRAIQSSAI